MSEIWNLSTLCRCCHSDGCFKKLNRPYQNDDTIEIYEIMLQEALGLKIIQPSLDQASYTICDNCIKRLRDASQFREQVLACEQKFKIYFTNEQFLNTSSVQIENVKTEVETNDTEQFDMNVDDDIQQDDCLQPDVYRQNEVSTKDNCLQLGNYKQNSVLIKKEVAIEVEIMNPVEMKEEKGEDIKSEEKKAPVKKMRKKPKLEERMRRTTVYNRNYLKSRRKNYDAFIITQKTDNGLKYSCKNCKGTYNTQKDIYKHITYQHHNRCKCEQCGRPFKYTSYLEKHRKICDGKPYVCTHCDKKFDYKYRLTAHEKSHTNGNQQLFKCDICQKELRYKNTLRKHILLHTGENKAELCDICGWSFNQKCNLEAHVRAVHLKMRPYSCSICGKTYTAKKHVKGHMKTAHSGNPKPYQCEYCSKCFACPKSFKIHRLTHENHFSCRYCPLVFDNKKDVEIHTKSHTKEHLLNSPYACHICGKVLLSKFTLNRHLEIHSGIRRFACDVCGLKFTQKSLLLRHNFRKHDPNRKVDKVKCDLCKKFVIDIDKHMDIHDADKRKYFCDMCGKNYPTNNALTRHKEQKHYGVSYDCDICGKKYIKKGSLLTHKLKVHELKKEIIENVASIEDMELTSVIQ